ncbi:MAG: hypothetical protein WBE34_00090, partial [Candidatus Nitrosopolaris sp.]
PQRLLTVLNKIKNYRYDPKKILAEFSNIKSFKRRENVLKDGVCDARKSDVRIQTSTTAPTTDSVQGDWRR